MQSSTLSQIPFSRKILATALLLVLSIAFALGYLNTLLSYAQADGEQGFSPVSDLKAAFAEPRFAVMVRGPMAKNAGPDVETLFEWAMRGGPEAEYKTTIQPAMKKRNCAKCHNGFEQVSLATYQDIQPLLQKGKPVKQLGDLSHSHLFGIGLALAVIACIFSCTGLSERVKAWFIGLAYGALLCDIGSWWGAKFLSPGFVYLLMVAGAVTVLCVTVMVLGSLLSLWRPHPSAASPS